MVVTDGKLTGEVIFLCVCPLMDDKLHHDIVKMAVKQSAAGKCFCNKL